MGACVIIYLSALAGWLMFSESQRRSFTFDAEPAPSPRRIAGGVQTIPASPAPYSRFDVLVIE